MRKIVLTSFTPLGAPGGVPRWNRDFVSGFPEGSVKHYSWSDLVKDVGRDYPLPEWDKAKYLNQWLIQKKKIERDDIILTDGFWGIGLEEFPNVISVAHGNWGHVTADDVAKGLLPEFPDHHRIQIDYRRKHLARGGKIVAVSDFIADQCKLQWNFDMPVINNGIDLKKFVPTTDRKPRKRPVIIHGTTTTNKGFDHIDALKKLDADVLLLDEAAGFFGIPKYPALAQADLVVHPSAHEGNSYFVLETLASSVPILSYDVGLMYKARKVNAPIGRILERSIRSPEETLEQTRQLLLALKIVDVNPRDWVLQFSLEMFQRDWRRYLRQEFGYDSSSGR